jgi:DNA polymerase/3'-5' exonuclease PolX
MEVVEGDLGLFETFKKRKSVPTVPLLLDALVARGVLSKRLAVNGRVSSWGPENKHAVHVASGVPVDFFATTFENWWMTVVIRTGPKDFNLRLIEAARKQGLALNAYGTFTGPTGDKIELNSEREVFDRAGLPWLEPWERK